MTNKNKNILKNWKLRNKLNTNFFKIEDEKTQSFVLSCLLHHHTNDILDTLNRFVKAKI